MQFDKLDTKQYKLGSLALTSVHEQPLQLRLYCEACPGASSVSLCTGIMLRWHISDINKLHLTHNDCPFSLYDLGATLLNVY